MLPTPYPGLPPLKKRSATHTIFVHAADTPPGMDIGVRDIHRWHVVDNHWSAAGYHFVIRRDGTVEGGRPHDTVGAHVASRNSDSIGICLVGGKGKFSGEDPYFHYTEAQIMSLVVTIRSLMEIYPNVNVLGHRDADPGKQCPSFDAKAWWLKVSHKVA